MKNSLFSFSNQSGLGRQLITRLVITLAIALLVVVVLSLALYETALKQTGKTQIAQTLSFYQDRLQEMDENWISEAVALKSRIEYARVLEDVSQRQVKFKSFFTIQGDQRLFGHILILDRNGQLVVKVGNAEDELLAELPKDRRLQKFWLYEAHQQEIYRVFQLPIWLGKEGQGYMLAVMPIEHATLYSKAFIDTDLFLLREKVAVATSLGSGGLSDKQLALGDGGWNVDGGRVEQRAVRWSEELDAPSLLVRQKVKSTFSSVAVWAASASVVGGLMLVVWLALGGWLLGTAKRVEHLETASKQFSRADYTGSVDGLFEEEARQVDEISKLSESMKRLMLEERKKEAQLRDMNISLESRVEHRTQELNETNVKLQDTIESLSNTQNELIHSGKMASLGNLVAGISHEINTPLGISVTSASSLREELLALQTDFSQGTMKRSSLEHFIFHADEASDILLRNLARASDLIRSFKSVAVDQTSDDQRMINLHSYMDEIILSLHPNLKRTLIKVENNCDDEITIETLPGAIYQIISNFVMNALIHAYEPGQKGTLRIFARMDGDNLALDFSDDGKGIAENDIGKVFDPFYTTKRGQGGSGLGLNIVYNLVRTALKGSIQIESKLGAGTTFKIKFPVLQK